MKNRKILISGAAGFLGRHIVLESQKNGYETIALFRGNAQPTPISNETWIQCDLHNSKALKKQLSDHQPDAVIHLAGKALIQPNENAAALFKENVTATASLLDAIADSLPNLRFISVGSAAQYSPESYGASAICESAKQDPATLYGLSKKAQEDLANHYSKHRNLDIVFTRIFNVLGPGSKPHSFAPTLAKQIAAIENGKSDPPINLGPLSSIRDFIDVRDIARAFLALVHRGRRGETYNICSGIGISMRTLADQLLSAAGKTFPISEKKENHAVGFNASRAVGNPSKIKRETGWDPSINLKTSLQDLMNDWRSRIS